VFLEKMKNNKRASHQKKNASRFLCQRFPLGVGGIQLWVVASSGQRTSTRRVG